MKFRDEVPGADSKNFVKMKDGESITGVFRGDLYDFFVTWENKQSKVVPEGTPGAKFRFRINFIVKTQTGYEARILEQGATVYKDLKAIHQEYDLEQTAVKITRHGSTMNDTSYTLMPLRAPVTDEVRKVKLLDLSHPQTQHATGPIPVHEFGTPPTDGNDDEIPF